MDEGNKLTAIVSGSLLLLLLVGLVGILITLQGLPFYLELMTLLLLTVMGILGFQNYGRGGKTFLFFVFVFYLANLVVLWHLKGFFYLVLLLLALFGFMINLPVKKERVKPVHQEEKDHLVKVVPHAPPPQKEKEPEKKAATFSPGKYVASSKGNVYHEPKCEWAKKIKAKQVWFSEKKDAEEKQYKAHGCVQ